MPRTNPGPSAFLDPAAPTLARVIDRLATAEPDPRRRGEMASAVRTLCRVLGRLPHELPADTALLNRLMRTALPAAVGVTPARWANVRSLALRAMSAHRLPDHAGPPPASADPGLGGARRPACPTASRGRSCRG